MKQADREDYIQRYESRLKTYGRDPQTLGWGTNPRQNIRFGVLAGAALTCRDSSVLDVGCGFADLYDYLKSNGWQGTYTGVDIVPGLIQLAKARHPDLSLLVADITGDDATIETHDYVIASGTMNAVLPSGENDRHTWEMLQAMFTLANKAVCVDFMSTLVDYTKEGAWHTDPALAINYAKRLTTSFSLQHDYLRYEFALFLNKNDNVSNRGVFSTHEERITDRQGVTN